MRDFVCHKCFQIMFLMNVLASFYHLKAKFNKMIVVFIMGAIVH